MNDIPRCHADRIIPSVNLEGRPEWFCLVREGMLGPYTSEEAAFQALDDFLRWARQVGCTGNRDDDASPVKYRKHPDTLRWLAAGVVDQSRL
jgi:hypothetical protein